MSHQPAAQQADELQQQQMVAALAEANGPIAAPQPVGFRLARLLHWDAAADQPLCSLQLEHNGAAALAFLRQESLPFLRVFRHSVTGEERIACSDMLTAFGVKNSGYKWNANFPRVTMTRIVGAQSILTITLADFALYVAWIHNRLEELQGPEAQELLGSAQMPSFHRMTFQKSDPAAVTGRAFMQAALNALLGQGVQLVQVTRFEGGGFMGAATVVAGAPALAAVASEATSSSSSSSSAHAPFCVCSCLSCSSAPPAASQSSSQSSSSAAFPAASALPSPLASLSLDAASSSGSSSNSNLAPVLSEAAAAAVVDSDKTDG